MIERQVYLFQRLTIPSSIIRHRFRSLSLHKLHLLHELFSNYSTELRLVSLFQLPFRLIYAECKRRKYFVSFAPLCISSTRSRKNNNYNYEQCNDSKNYKISKSITSEKDKHKYFYPYLIGASTISAFSVFSWDENGINNEELQEAASDQYLLDMPNSNVVEILVDNGWENLLIKERLLIFRRYDEELEVYTYKILGSFTDVSALLFLYVQLDLDYRQIWDKQAVQLDIIETNASMDSDVVHWIHKFPYPLNNRDYVYIRRFSIDTSSETPKIILKCRSTDHPLLMKKNKCVRVTRYESSMLIQPKRNLEEKGMRFLLTYYDDAKTSMPVSTYSYLAQTGIPDFVEKMHIAAKNVSKDIKLNDLLKRSQCPISTGDDENNLF